MQIHHRTFEHSGANRSECNDDAELDLRSRHRSLGSTRQAELQRACFTASEQARCPGRDDGRDADHQCSVAASCKPAEHRPRLQACRGRRARHGAQTAGSGVEARIAGERRARSTRMLFVLSLSRRSRSSTPSSGRAHAGNRPRSSSPSSNRCRGGRGPRDGLVSVDDRPCRSGTESTLLVLPSARFQYRRLITSPGLADVVDDIRRSCRPAAPEAHPGAAYIVSISPRTADELASMSSISAARCGAPVAEHPIGIWPRRTLS